MTQQNSVAIQQSLVAGTKAFALSMIRIVLLCNVHVLVFWCSWVFYMLECLFHEERAYRLCIVGADDLLESSNRERLVLILVKQNGCWQKFDYR